jgi:hypothetical protein
MPASIHGQERSIEKFFWTTTHSSFRCISTRILGVRKTRGNCLTTYLDPLARPAFSGKHCSYKNRGSNIGSHRRSATTHDSDDPAFGASSHND